MVILRPRATVFLFILSFFADVRHYQSLLLITQHATEGQPHMFMEGTLLLNTY